MNIDLTEQEMLAVYELLYASVDEYADSKSQLERVNTIIKKLEEKVIEVHK